MRRVNPHFTIQISQFNRMGPYLSRRALVWHEENQVQSIGVKGQAAADVKIVEPH